MPNALYKQFDEHILTSEWIYPDANMQTASMEFCGKYGKRVSLPTGFLAKNTQKN